MQTPSEIRIDLRYVILVAALLVAAVAPVYLAVGVGLSLGWTLQEVRGTAGLVGALLGLWGVMVVGILAAEIFGHTKPLWLTVRNTTDDNLTD